VSAELSPVSGIAGRYATALFELSLEAKSLDAVGTELDRLARLIDEVADLKRLVRSPLVRRDDQMRAMAAVLQAAGFGDLVRRFVGVVTRNRRLFVLPQMVHDFRTLAARHKGETVARVVAASPLSDRQVDQLKGALKEALKRDVTVDVAVNPALIGGLTVKVGSRLVDASVRSKLQSLKMAMKGVA
jgi:F-type H+-transporting ATPase subunit delta